MLPRRSFPLVSRRKLLDCRKIRRRMSSHRRRLSVGWRRIRMELVHQQSTRMDINAAGAGTGAEWCRRMNDSHAESPYRRTLMYARSKFTRKVSLSPTAWAIWRGFHAGYCVLQVVSSLTDRRRRPLVAVVRNRCGIGPAKSLTGIQSDVHYGWQW
jgi:hypothetical protein